MNIIELESINLELCTQELIQKKIELEIKRKNFQGLEKQVEEELVNRMNGEQIVKCGHFILENKMTTTKYFNKPLLEEDNPELVQKYTEVRPKRVGFRIIEAEEIHTID